MSQLIHLKVINELKDIRDLEIINPLPLKDITNQFWGRRETAPPPS